jgi:hypothetical protein
MARAIKTSAESVEWLALMGRDEPPGLFEWMRPTGERVKMQVLADGTIKVWKQEWVEQASQKAPDFATGCAAVEEMCHNEVLPRRHL